VPAIALYCVRASKNGDHRQGNRRGEQTKANTNWLFRRQNAKLQSTLRQSSALNNPRWYLSVNPRIWLYSLLSMQARSLLILSYVIECIGIGLISKTWFILKMAFRLTDSNVALAQCACF
jgi:hypothetical protein